MSLRAYQQAAQRSESPRDAEYRLFAQVTRALMDLQTTPRDNFGAWIEVLHWNRRMWAALADDCSSTTNTLPEPVRAQIISLSLFVHRHSSHVMQKKGDLETLIDINRMMMQGLSGRPEAA